MMHLLSSLRNAASVKPLQFYEKDELLPYKVHVEVVLAVSVLTGCDSVKLCQPGLKRCAAKGFRSPSVTGVAGVSGHQKLLTEKKVFWDLHTFFLWFLQER